MSTHTYREVLHEVQQLSLVEQRQLLKDLMTMLQRQEQLEGRQEAIQQQKSAILQQLIQLQEEQSAILQQLIQSQKEPLASLQHPKEAEPLHSILELRGLGKEIWKDVDVDQYIEQERNSWDG